MMLGKATRSSRGCIPAAIGIAMLFSAASCAADAPAPKREIPIAPVPGELDILRTVAVPPAANAVVSDAVGVLVVGLKPKVLSSRQRTAGVKIENGPHLSVFRLDEKGEPAATATSITLPRPDSFGERQNYPLALAAHPKLPLLYVWQDVQPPADGAQPDDAKADGLRHLHVYDLASAEPQLVQSLAEGESFARHQLSGALGFDRTANRLFVPNMQRRTTTTFAPSIGYLRLLDDGLVVPNEEETAQVADGGPNTTADRTGAVSAAARKAYLEQVRTGKVLERTVRYATSATSTFAGFPCGLGFHSVSDTVTVVCGALGPVTWDEANRRAQFNSVTFYPVVGVGYRLRMAAHEQLPVLFFTGTGSGFVYRIEHVGGFPTMLPQRGALAGVAAIASPPVLLGDRKLLACGSPEKLHLVEFDDAGRFTGKRTDVAVAGSTGEALVYSRRFDKLYTTVPEGAK